MWFFSKIWWVIPLGIIWFSFGGCNRESMETSYKAGRDALASGDFVKAAKHLQKAVDLSPSSERKTLARIQNHLGLAQWHVKNHAPAKDAFSTAQELDPRFFEPAYNLGLLHEEMGDRPQATLAFEDALRRDTNDTRSLEALSRMALADGDTTEALHNLNQARNRQQGNPRVLTSIANILLREKRPADAAQQLRAAIQTSDYAPALFNLARLYHKHEDPVNALEYYRRHVKVETHPKFLAMSRTAINRLGVYGEDPLSMAQTEHARGADPIVSPLGARLHVSSPAPARETRSHARPARSDKSELLQAAATAFDQGDTNTAVGMCLQAASRARRSGDPMGEENALKKATTYGPELAAPLYALGRFYERANEPQSAYEAFDRAVAVKPTWVDAHLAKARMAMADNHLANARDGLEGAIAADQSNPDPLWQLCELRIQTAPKNANTRRSLETFIKRFPRDPRSAQARSKLRTMPKTQLRPGFGNSVAKAPAKATIPVRRHSLVSVRPVIPRPGLPATERTPANQGVGIGTFTSTRQLRPRTAPAEALPTTPEGLFRHAHTLRRKRDYNEAAKVFEKVLILDPDFHDARLDLAETYEDLGDIETAAAYYARTQELDPANATPSIRLGHLHLERGDRPSAIQHYTRATKLDPAEPEPHIQLGQLFRADSRMKAASRNHLMTFLQLAPRDPRAADARRWLDTL